MRNKRKGFTLVELLIVIVVIGILSAMMMMSSSEAVSSAKASKITSNLRNLQTAALAYWGDNMNKFNKATPDTPNFDSNGTDKGIIYYLKEDDKSQIDSNSYSVVGVGGSDQDKYAQGWFIMYTFQTGDNDRVKEKIAGRAASLGILASNASNASTFNGTNNKEAIYIRVR